MTRFLSFSLGKEEYAIELLSVREVIGMPGITPVPHTPPHFLGIMNLRGQVISVMDLRKKFGFPTTATQETAVVILNFHDLSLGVVVDSVNSVLNPDPETLSPKPELQGSPSTEFVTGVYRKDNQLVLLLDIAKALNLDDHKAIHRQQASMKVA